MLLDCDVWPQQSDLVDSCDLEFVSSGYRPEYLNPLIKTKPFGTKGLTMYQFPAILEHNDVLPLNINF